MVSNEFLRKQTERSLKEMSIRADCQTCGKVFLEISGSDYMALSDHLTNEQPDKWFVETGIHWVENYGHLILMDFINAEGKVIHQENITEIWNNKLRLDVSRNPKASKELMKPYFYIHREECKNKAI